MNIELVKQHINASLGIIDLPKLKADGSNASDFFVADVVGNKTFAQNFGGYPRSEIAQINEAVNLQVARSLFSSLEDYTPASNPNAGLSDLEISLGHKSRYQQTPSELQDYIHSQLSIRDAKRAEIASRLAFAKKAVAKKAAEVKPTNVNVEPE